MAAHFGSSFAAIIDPSDALAGESRGDGTKRGVQTSPGEELTVLVSNFRGLRQECGELGVMVAKYGKPHFLCLTETHFEADPDSSITPTGYVVKARADQTKHGGGVIIMAREDILCDKYPTEKYKIHERAEICAVNIPSSDTACPMTLVCVYTQPSTSNTTLIEQLELLYEQQALIVGDFNAHEEEWLKSTTTDARGKATRV